VAVLAIPLSWEGLPLYRNQLERSKIGLMAGCLSNTKRFRHGRPDRGRY